MRVQNVLSYGANSRKLGQQNGQNNTQNHQVSFGRMLTPSEIPACKKAIQKGFDTLDKRFTVIFPDRCNPSLASENTGMGSPFSKGAKKLSKMFEKLGITGIQRDPGGNLRPAYLGETTMKPDPISGLHVDKFGNLRPFDTSPYISTESGNELNISLQSLASKDFGSILSSKTLKTIVKNNPNKGTDKINFAYVDEQMKLALKEAYTTFIDKVSNINNLEGHEKKKITSLSKKFEQYKQTHSQELEKDSIYAALSKENKTDIWQIWPDEDKNLYSDLDPQKAKQRIDYLKDKQGEEIDFYKFKQFLLNEQGIHKQHFDKNHGITSIADEKVAISDIGVWANQKLFLKGYSLGCPPDMFSKTGQAWGFPVMDPEKIIDKDGNLGEAGKFLYNKYKKIFSENKGGVRIDHIIGLIDPFVYPSNKLPTDVAAGRLYSSPASKELGKYARKTIDQYATILEKIVIPAAEEVGVKKESIICEDLGTLTDPVVATMQKLKMPGVRVTEFVNPYEQNHLYRGKNVSAKDVIMAGSHDNDTLAQYAEDLKSSGQIEAHARYLAQDLLPNATSMEKERFVKDISNDTGKFVEAKQAELFASPAKHVQMFFKDFFGFDKHRYNMPGTTAGQNWNYVLKDNFEEEFFNKALPENKGLNVPQALATALKARGNNSELVQELEKWAKILKEPQQ